MSYAHHHIPSFLDLPINDDRVQMVARGGDLTAESIRRGKYSLKKPILITDSAESIGMKMPPKQSLDSLAQYVGHDYPVHVMDVSKHEELEGWTLGDLIQYFQSRKTGTAVSSRRKAAQKAANSLNPQMVLNQLSLEFSDLPLRQYVQAPAFVRKLDWIETAWPDRENEYPKVQYYLLTTAEGAYTDFHVDFGGSSVWYHVFEGRKDFCLISPKYLETYERWVLQKDQETVFFPTLVNEQPIRIQLEPGQTFIIPSGWIHAVYTPVDSVVFGGNWLHGFDVDTQMKVHEVEMKIRVQKDFKLPLLCQLHFYVAAMYLKQIRSKTMSKEERKGMPKLLDYLEQWWADALELEAETGEQHSLTPAAKDAAFIAGYSLVHDFLESIRTAIDEGDDSSFDAVVSSPPTENAPGVKTSDYNEDDKRDAPRLKIKLTSEPSPVESGGFKISLSSSTVQSRPSVYGKTQKTRKETALLMDESGAHQDDDWVPDTALHTEDEFQGTKRRGRIAASPSPKKATTARSRLLSKMRR